MTLGLTRRELMRAPAGAAMISALMTAALTPGRAGAADACAPAGDAAAHEALLERYMAAVNAHDTSSFPDLFTETYIQHSGRSPSGLAAQIANAQRILETWPDFHWQVEDRIISGDKIVARTFITATHTQVVQGFAPTGRRVAFGTIDIWRVADGKFAEHWDLVDVPGLQKQLRGD
jgi:predicted ester cyclase